MSDNTAIEWWDQIDPTAGGRILGAYKSAAAKTGCSLEEWIANRSAGTKWCFRCRTWKIGAEFSVDSTRRGGRSSTCKACTSDAATASRYKITRRELAVMRQASGGICPICNRRVRALVIDHDHRDGSIRGLLCQRCNIGLGQFGDNASLMRDAIAYLERANG